MSVSLHELEGNVVESLTFVSDYFQLHAQGFIINVYNRSWIQSGTSVLQEELPCFEHYLRMVLGKTIRAITLVPDERTVFDMGHDLQLGVSLKPADYYGPEAIVVMRPNDFLLRL